MSNQHANDFSENPNSMSLAEVEIEANENVKKFLYQQRRLMEDRIKNFALEQNQKFDELCQSVHEEKNDFMQIVDNIKRRHDMITDSESFDKENNSKLTMEKNGNYFQSEESTSMFFFVFDPKLLSIY